MLRVGVLSRSAHRGVVAVSRRALAGPAVVPPSDGQGEVWNDYKQYKPSPLVVEEEFSKLPAGHSAEHSTVGSKGAVYPTISEKEIWENPNTVLPERHELFWDDGTAAPEWYVDRDWHVTTGTAVARLTGVLGFLLIGVGGVAVWVGDSWMQVPTPPPFPSFTLSPHSHHPVTRSQWQASPRVEHGMTDLQSYGSVLRTPSMKKAALAAGLGDAGEDE